MKHRVGIITGLIAAAAFMVGEKIYADDVINEFVRSACLDCHDTQTETGLDLSKLSLGFDNAGDYRSWVKVFDKVARGEMPPKDAAQPAIQLRQQALARLNRSLTDVNRQNQELYGRVPSRRLTRYEYEHVLHDLLGIGGQIARFLPPENEAASFDVVAEKQEMSSVHVKGLLAAADLALDEAIELSAKPNLEPRVLDYYNSPYIQMWVDREVRRGGGTVFKTEQDVVTFRGANYVLRSDTNGIRFEVPGRYRITVTAAAHNPRSSITVSLKRQNDQQGQSELFAAWDLSGDEYRTVATTKYLRPDDYIYVSADELDPAPDGKVIYNAQPASKYQGEGVRIHKVVIQGPLETVWPPQRTRDLFPGIDWEFRQPRHRAARAFYPVFSKSPRDHIRDSVIALAPRAFGRDVSEEEIESLVSLADAGLAAGQDFVEAARIPLRAILISPEVIFQTGKSGRLDDIDLARRVSAFLWRSIPDSELIDLAVAGTLSTPDVLRDQVDRMLADPRSERFIHGFLDQWLELRRIDETTPDNFLYPEYDDVLRRAMLAETRGFVKYLIEHDLSVSNLIDSDFTFMNRKLAEHYGIEGVLGEQIRKVTLPADSVRGGIITQASIAKITANGTVTTPVKRGNFVLSNLLGLPPSPPPPNIGSIEPDTRGATTIRDTLEKHQENETCAVCHRKIDPPGFALEAFDPVGNFRTQYRNSRGVTREANPGLRFATVDYDLGQKVDASGVTAEGVAFRNVIEYKRNLLSSADQVARNVVSQLIVFSTGAEIDFADRTEVERILRQTKNDQYRMKTLIHQVVQSRLFKER
ncbi:MAG: hypothetical protein CMJ76_10980 [Planctomycetaceae bacterium]|nr:hypothetical protein [Planctomycetaceae bacterium]